MAESLGRQRTTGPDGARIPAGNLTASGKMIDLTDRKMVNSVGAMRMGWQTHAWDYRDLVPELASAMRFRANVISKIGLKIGQVVEGEDEPIDTDSEQCTLSPALKKAAQDALNKLPWRSGYAFLGVLDTCFGIAGESWLHGSTDPATKKETWEVLSTDEVQPMGSGSRLGIVEIPGRAARPIDPKAEVLIRLWVPHPRFKKLSDAPMRSLQDVLEDIILCGRELRAAARSRVAANGILFVTPNMSMTTPQGVNINNGSGDFVQELNAAILAPIANEGDAGSVAPIIVEADKDDITAVKHVSLVRETSADLNEKLSRSLTRMAESIDVPPTVITGLQDTNHWNAYVIDDTTFSNHLEPGVRMEVDALTEGYLRPSLIQPVTQGGYGLDPVEVEQVVIWYDASKVTQSGNRAQDAKDAYDRFAIGGATLREALGFNDGDAPTDEDLLRMLASKVSTDPNTAGQLLQKLLPDMGIVVAPPVAPVAPHPVVNIPPEQQRNQVTPPQRPELPVRGTRPTGSSVPLQKPSQPPTSGAGRVASGAPDTTAVPLRIVDGSALARIDAGLLDRLMVACEDAVQRALEKANARVRSAAQKKIDKGDLAEHGEDLASWLGETGVAELGLTEEALLALAFAYLEGKFIAWTSDAIKNAVLVMAKMLGLELTAVASLRRTLASRQKAAWERLHDQLKARALARLYGKHGTDEHTGEGSAQDVVRAGDIRTALAVIGGEPSGGVKDGGESAQPLGGLALGSTITDTITEQAGPPVGLMWVYGDQPRNTFQPHRGLDDHRFNSRTDKRLMTSAGTAWLGPYYHPGDHSGCRCAFIPAWIFPQNAAGLDPELVRAISDAQTPEAPAMRDIRRLAEMDDAAGRSNTTAQQQRDQRDRVLRIRNEWLDSTEGRP